MIFKVIFVDPRVAGDHKFCKRKTFQSLTVNSQPKIIPAKEVKNKTQAEFLDCWKRIQPFFFQPAKDLADCMMYLPYFS